MTISSIQRLLDIMTQLRDPETGCAWDIKQDFKSISKCVLEEAYEVYEAIEDEDMDMLRDELGDLLLQVVFHSQMAKEQDIFSFDDVADAISEKMINRHPHIFEDAVADTPEQVKKNWEAIKAEERAKKAKEQGNDGHISALDGVSKSLPALIRAKKLQDRAARVGFEWPDISGVLDKIEEELAELRIEVESPNRNVNDIAGELGDVMFVLSNLARWLKIDPEEAVRNTNAKFIRRFNGVEKKLQEIGRTPEESTLEEMDKFWDEVKAEEKELKKKAS